MNMIPIPSESCPHCQIAGTFCELWITNIPKAREIEEDFLIELGKRYKDKRKVKINEAYTFEKIVCRNNK